MSEVRAVTGASQLTRSYHVQTFRAFLQRRYRRNEEEVAAAEKWIKSTFEMMKTAKDDHLPSEVQDALKEDFLMAIERRDKAQAALDKSLSSLLGSLQIGSSKRDDEKQRMRTKAWFENVNYNELEATTQGNGLELTCAIMNHTGDAESACAAHLLPHGADKYEMARVGLDNINSMENMLSLAFREGIPPSTCMHHACVSAFACSLAIQRNFPIAGGSASYETTDGALSLKLVVLDPTVREEAIYEGSEKTIGDFEGKSFTCPNGRTPSTMVLSYHVEKAYQRAKRKNWISQDEEPQDFGTPLRNNMLSFKHNEMQDLVSRRCAT